MIDKLELTKNAQFYLFNNGDQQAVITDQMILDILNASTDNRDPDSPDLLSELRKKSLLPNGLSEYNYSVRVFPTIRPVYFINKEIDEDGYFDRIYAFIIIFEFDKHLVVIKKSCATISDAIENNFDLINSSTIAQTFNDSDVSFQRISIRNMTVSDKAIRNRTYEAPDLKGTFSTHAAGRSIPLFLKFRHGSTIKTISGTGRLVESSQRINFENIAEWAYNQVLLIKNGGGIKDFLDAFAKQKKLPEVLSLTSPNAILIESPSLYDQIKEDGIKIKYTNKNGNDVELNTNEFERLFQHLENAYPINSAGEMSWKAGKANIRINKETITFDSRYLRLLKVNDAGKNITLQRYIIKNGFYSITFNDPKYMYFIGNCFEDTSGISEVNSILEMLYPQDDIDSVNSEKGKFKINSVSFNKESMFSVVEKIHKKDDYIFCDDLGTEWADHITLNKKDSCISFIHSKHGKKSTSASNLHDVVGQAVKNLGYMYFNKDDFTKKIQEKFTGNYISADAISTNIPRARKGDLNTVDEYLKDLLKDVKLHRKCILSCSFLSKDKVKAEFAKIQGGGPVKGHVTQLLWILSSFAHAVKEVNAIPIVYCSK